MTKLLSLAVVTVLVFAFVPVGAQQPVAPPPPQIAYGAPINLEHAKKVVADAEASAWKKHASMATILPHSGGHLTFRERRDDSQLRPTAVGEAQAPSSQH